MDICIHMNMYIWLHSAIVILTGASLADRGIRGSSCLRASHQGAESLEAPVCHASHSAERNQADLSSSFLWAEGSAVWSRTWSERRRTRHDPNYTGFTCSILCRISGGPETTTQFISPPGFSVFLSWKHTSVATLKDSTNAVGFRNRSPKAHIVCQSHHSRSSPDGKLCVSRSSRLKPIVRINASAQQRVWARGSWTPSICHHQSKLSIEVLQ